MRVTRKILTRAAANLFLLINFPEIISFFLSLFFFAFFGLCFFCWCCWFVAFFRLKLYILIHIRLSGRVSDKIFSSDRFPETRLLFFVLTCYFCWYFFLKEEGRASQKMATLEWVTSFVVWLSSLYPSQKQKKKNKQTKKKKH